MTIAPAQPAAKQIPTTRVHHGDTFVDEYAWLADKEDPDTIAFLEAQNAYTQALTAGQADLREKIFAEIKGRNQETDLTVPVRKGGWWYYTRTIEGKQYSVQCRRAVGEPGERPPISEDGSPLPGEEVLLDGNELAGDHEFFSLGAYSLSPDGQRLAYSTDYLGNERFTMRIKDLVTGELAADEIPDTYYGAAWSRDGSTLFYVTVDDAWRPYKIWRHVIGTAAGQDEVVFTEADERFFAEVDLTRSQRYLMITTASKLTSEVLLLDADEPGGEFRVVVPRRQGVEYSVDHQVTPDGAERLLILHNDGAENFELATASPADPATWTPLVPHQQDTRLLDVGAFASHLVLFYRKDGLTGLRIMGNDGSDREVAFDEPVYTVMPGSRCRTRASTGPRTTSSSGSGRLPTTAPGSLSRWCARRARAAMARRRSCCTATAAMRRRLTLTSRSRGCPSLTAASRSRPRTSGAAGSLAGAGTRTASCCTRRTRSPTSSPAPGISPRPAGPARTG
jgi:oligopeptidase B